MMDLAVDPSRPHVKVSLQHLYTSVVLPYSKWSKVQERIFVEFQ